MLDTPDRRDDPRPRPSRARRARLAVPALLLAVSACSGSARATNDAAGSARPVSGGTLTFAASDEPAAARAA